MNRPRSGTSEQIIKGLGYCSTWVYDKGGDSRKQCSKCPYRDPDDPAGLNCGERLMNDANQLIGSLNARIEELEETVRKYVRELARASQREYND